MKRSYKHMLGHCLIGVPEYKCKADMEYPTFKDTIAINEGELNVLLEDAAHEYRKSLVDAVENSHKVVMLNMYESLLISMKVYDGFWLSLQDSLEDNP